MDFDKKEQINSWTAENAGYKHFPPPPPPKKNVFNGTFLPGC